MEDDVWGMRGKGAIVTGGGAAGDGIGNGRAAAMLLARAGAGVLVVDREIALAERTVEMIRAEGGVAEAASYDVTDGAACAAMVAHAERAFGRLDLLDNNVGIGGKGSVVDVSEAEWTRVMRVNVDSMFLVSKYAVPAMKRAGGGDRAEPGDGGGSWQGWHPGELRGPRPGVHADGVCARDERLGAGGAAEGLRDGG